MKHCAFRSVVCLLVLCCNETPAYAAEGSSRIQNVVLVHGALLDGSSWRGVYDRLVKDGYHVSVVQEPLTGFDSDVAATQRVLDQQDGPVVLVGHSYGGSVITVAGMDPKVRVLVYVAALQPDVGETSAEVAPPTPDAAKDLRPTADGYVSVDTGRFAIDVMADVPKAQADYFSHAQVPILGASFNAKMPVAAWRTKPSYAVIASQDQALDVAIARRMTQRAGSHVTEINGSHAVYISQPGAVARVIERASHESR